MILQMFHWAASVLFWIALVLVLTALFKRNRGPAKFCSDGKVHFAPRWWFVCSWAFMLVRFGFTGNDYLRNGLKEPPQFAIGVLIWVAAIGGVSMLPGVLVASSEALEEVNWVWRN